jgi:hypothetical protein
MSFNRARFANLSKTIRAKADGVMSNFLAVSRTNSASSLVGKKALMLPVPALIFFSSWGACFWLASRVLL